MNKSNETSSRDDFMGLLAQIDHQFNRDVIMDNIENQIGIINKLEDYVYRLNISTLVQLKTFNISSNNIGKVIDLSDRLYGKCLHAPRLGVSHLRKYYLRVLNALDSLLHLVEVNHFDLLGDLCYSKYSYCNLRIFLRKGLSDLNKKLALANYSREFIAVINSGVLKQIQNKSITYSEVNYLRVTLAELNSINISKRQEILIYLIKRNFHPTELYDFCINLVDQILLNEPNLYKRIDHLITLQEEILKTQLEQRLSQVKTRNTPVSYTH